MSVCTCSSAWKLRAALEGRELTPCPRHEADELAELNADKLRRQQEAILDAGDRRRQAKVDDARLTQLRAELAAANAAELERVTAEHGELGGMLHKLVNRNTALNDDDALTAMFGKLGIDTTTSKGPQTNE